MFKLPGKLEFEKSSSDGKFRITGIMSAPVVDLEGEVITREAYPDIMQKVKERADRNDPIPIVIEHRRNNPLPVGYIEDAFENENGLGFTAVIAHGSAGSLQNTVQELISQNVLRHVSIGGDVAKGSDAVEMAYDSGARKHVRRIKRAVVRELSLTGLPVNEEATFAMAKSLNTNSSSIQTLVDKFSKAFIKESISKSLEKAIENNDLSAIEDALKNLAVILQEQFGLAIDTDALTGAADKNAGAPGMATDGKNPIAQPSMNAGAEQTPPTQDNQTELPTKDSTETPGTGVEPPVEEELPPIEETPAQVPAIPTAPVAQVATPGIAPAPATGAPLADTTNADQKLTTLIDVANKIVATLTQLTGEKTEGKPEVKTEGTPEKAESKTEEAKETPAVEKKEKEEGTEEKKEFPPKKVVTKSQKLNIKGGDKKMEKRLICKSCNEDFAYNEEDVEKSFKFCPKCGKDLCKAIVDTELSKVYFIESVADALKVNADSSSSAVKTATGYPVTDSSLSGHSGNVDTAAVEANVKTATGFPVVLKSEGEVAVEKSVEKEQIKEKIQGNQLDDFKREVYLDENKKDIAGAVTSIKDANVIKREGFNTLYNDDQLERIVKKSMEPVLAEVETLKKSLNAGEGRKGVFAPASKIVKSIDKNAAENRVFLNALNLKK